MTQTQMTAYLADKIGISKAPGKVRTRRAQRVDRARAPKNIPALSKPINLRNLALAAKFYCGTANVNPSAQKRVLAAPGGSRRVP